MLFNSLSFLIFFPLVTVLYFLLPHRWRWAWLLAASCYFYMAFVPIYILILFFTIIIDYIAGIMIEDATGRRRKLFLVMSLVANIGVLAVFKYFNFFAENVNQLLTLCHIAQQPPIPYLAMLLPIGLSFHTFQAMSYTIEVYRGNHKAERHFGIYSLYVMFYPQLVAGPIERPQNILHQFYEEHHFNSQNLLDGLRLMLWGFFKKLVIADRAALYVNIVYHDPAHFHWLNLVIAAVFFSIQIYCDFSGYSDIAIGAAKVMGFDLMTNFNRPYLAKNIQEFWAKWHISLSTWFRDYLYIPLGGNRISRLRTYINVAIVFTISGLWHGANWTFIIWGALHASFILIYMVYRNTRKAPSERSFIANQLSWVLTFVLVTLAWVFFRADTITDALVVLKHIATLYHGVGFKAVVTSVDKDTIFGGSSMAILISMSLLLFITEGKMTVKGENLNKSPSLDLVFCSIILFLVIALGMFNKSSFIYFQF